MSLHRAFRTRSLRSGFAEFDCLIAPPPEPWPSLDDRPSTRIRRLPVTLIARIPVSTPYGQVVQRACRCSQRGEVKTNRHVMTTVSLMTAEKSAASAEFPQGVTTDSQVVTVYHSSFDAVRDTLEDSVGFGALAENWQTVVLTIFGTLLWWKAPWKTLSDERSIDSVSGLRR